MTKVSIIVPTYNRPEFLDRALTSIDEQTYQDYEVIVVNDAGESVSDIVKKHPKTMYKWHLKNKGLAATRNTGIDVASGDYICFLDDDDVLYPDHFATLVNVLNTGFDFAYTDAYWWINETDLKLMLSIDYDRDSLRDRNLFPVMCAMMRRELLSTERFDETLESHEDWDLWQRLADKVDFVHIPKITAAYSKRGGQDQISNREYHKKAFELVKARYEKKPIRPKLLIFMPTYEKDGIIQAWPASVESFYGLTTPEGYDVDWVIGLDNPYGLDGKHKNTLHQYQQIQRRVLDEGYDGLVTFEHDMIVPEYGLEKLLNTDADIVYGLYMLRHGAYCVNAFLYIEDSPNIQKSMTYTPRKYAMAERRGWARVSGVGMGFTLFRRSVLERVNFRASGSSYPPDWAVAVDCTKYGMKQINRFDVKCGHIEKNGLPIYPTREGFEQMTRVKILKHFVYQGVYEPGMVCHIPTEKVDDFFRAGYIEILGEPDQPAVKIVRKPSKESSKAIKDKMGGKS